MKPLFCLFICLAIAASAQDSANPGRPPSNNTKEALVVPSATPEPVSFTKFDLDFKGGTPKELVDAISAAIGKPLNVIIPAEYQGQQLPSFKVQRVNVSDLFAALSNSSHTILPRYNGFVHLSYAFLPEGKRSEDSIWYFKVINEGPTMGQPNICRFYLLTPYLEAGLTVDDITTAIRTGWKMLSNSAVPQMSFHKETQLLITTGDDQQILVIDDVLNVLSRSKGKVAPTPPPTKNEKT